MSTMQRNPMNHEETIPEDVIANWQLNRTLNQFYQFFSEIIPDFKWTLYAPSIEEGAATKQMSVPTLSAKHIAVTYFQKALV